MFTILTYLSLLIAILLLVAGLVNAYRIKKGIDSIKSKKSYLFIVLNIATAVLLITLYAIYAIDKSNEEIDYQDFYVSLLFVFSSLFIFISSIVTNKMGHLLYKIDRLRVTDPLTKVYNRGYIDNAIKDEYSRCVRYGRQSCLLMIDVNKFKKINDSYGHLAGDSVLIHLAKAINKAKRESDTVGRFGGDEFIVLMPESTINESKHLAKRINKYILENLPQYNGVIIKYHIAIGSSEINPLEQDYSSWLHNADINLYNSKKSLEMLN